jgi:hypothetical protein
MFRNNPRVAVPLTFKHQQPHPQFQNQGYLPNGSSGPVPGAQALLPNNGRVVQSGATRVLCVADVRGIVVRLSPGITVNLTLVREPTILK